MSAVISPIELSREEDVLVTFLAGLTYRDVRLAEQVYGVLLPTGWKLRGIKITRRIFMDRHRRFYYGGSGHLARELSFGELLQHVSATFVQLRVRAAMSSAARRRRERGIDKPVVPSRRRGR